MAENNFVYPQGRQAFGFDWGKLSLTVAPEVNGAKTFSGGVVDLPPGQGHARHNHPGSEEIIFVISGEGEQMVETPEGDAGYAEGRAGLHGVRAGGPVPLDAEYREAGRCSCSWSIRRPVRNLVCANLPDFRLIPPEST